MVVGQPIDMFYICVGFVFGVCAVCCASGSCLSSFFVSFLGPTINIDSNTLSLSLTVSRWAGTLKSINKTKKKMIKIVIK